MNCVILQPSYIPWRGYFHQIHKGDVFVFLDDVQYDKHGWRNRNRIKTAHGTRWLTVPVQTRGCVSGRVPIHQIRISNQGNWAKKHARSLQQNYSHAPFFSEVWEAVEPFYRWPGDSLAELTIDLTITLAGLLGLRHCRFLRSSELGGNAQGTKTERILSLLKQLGATRYVTGPSAVDYLEVDRLHDAGVAIEYMSYDYPHYPQLHPPFDPLVSVLDLLFMAGPNAGDFIWGTETARRDEAGSRSRPAVFAPCAAR